MKSINGKILAICGLIAFFASAACENIALIKRPTPQLDSDEIVGEITSIDSRLRQIHFRHVTEVSSRAPTRTIRFDDHTRVLYRGREYPVSSLEVGDIVALQVGQSDPARNADLIRVQQSRRDRDVTATRNEIQRIEGTVERIDSRHEFELRDRSGAKVIVSLPPNPRESIVSQVERLRRGDNVLGEGRYVGRDRFELENLL